MKNKLIIIGVMILLMLVNTMAVFASTETTTTIKSDKEVVKAGEEFTVTVHVECPDRINGIDTTYSYDTEKLQLVKGSVADSNFANLGTDGQITLICNSTTIESADIYTLTFKVKEDVEVGSEAKVSLGETLISSFATDNSEHTISAQEITITVGDTTEEKPEPGQQSELTYLSLASHYDTIKKGEVEKLWLSVEIKGTGYVAEVKLAVKHKEQNIGALLSLNNLNGIDFIDLINIDDQAPLPDGDYYISDLYINPNTQDCIWYSRDSQDEGALPLEFNVEFKIANGEEETPGEDECEHTYGEYRVLEEIEKGHFATCSKCGEKHTEVHTYEDGKCSKCGVAQTLTDEDEEKEEDKKEEDKKDEDKKEEDKKDEDKKDETTADKEIPKAGLNTMLAFGIVAIAIVAVIMHRKNKKYQDIK